MGTVYNQHMANYIYKDIFTLFLLQTCIRRLYEIWTETVATQEADKWGVQRGGSDFPFFLQDEL